MQHSHKAGALKQVNKSHKQSKASKRSIKLKSGGRVEAGEKMSMKMKWVWTEAMIRLASKTARIEPTIRSKCATTSERR